MMKFREIELLQEAAIATFRGREGGWGGEGKGHFSVIG